MVEDSKFSNTILTNIGHQMLTSISNGNKKITYTKAEAYAQDVSSISNETLQALTSLQGKELSANLLVSNDNGNVVTITANFRNKGLTNDVVFNSIGWFAKLDTDDAERGITANQEYLIGITPANSTQTLVAPPADQSASQAISLNLNMTLSDAANVNMTVSDAGAVHFNQLDDQLAKYTTTSDLTKLLAGKADLGLSYTKAELDAKLLNLTTDTNGKVSADQVQALISDKANISDVYTKSQIDSALSTRDTQISTKANISDVYTKSQIDSDFSARDTQINTKANISDVYTKSDVDSALAADRGRLGKLEGTQTLDSPDFNSITASGVYYITNNTPANIKNNPVVQWGVLVVSSGNGQRISQVYYPDDGSPQWCRLLNGSNWLPWYQLSTKKDVSNAIDLANQARTTANTKANASDVYTKADIPLAFKGVLTSTDDMNKVLESGMYITQGAAPQNFPPSDINHGFWGTILVYNHDAGQILQLWLVQGNVFHRWITNSAPQTEWQRYADQSDITDLQNSVNSKVNVDGPLFKHLTQFNNWSDLFDGYSVSGIAATNGSRLVAFRDDTNGGNTVGSNGAGIAFGGGDTKGVLSVDYGDHTARIAGGNGDKPNWSEDIAWKSDITNLQNTINQQSQTIQSLTTRLANAENEINYIKANYVEGKRFPASQEAQAEAWENEKPTRLAMIEK
ncbi:pyocin knob domain-containing protein [Lactobacillus helveticus]|uniref:pyocin knob domain-containing protein n=1 Tax=Lactobacillus helveticus TaxID=1587 RepID=UPI00069AD935|nr:pyocin knob domain-containing protein [Lactobacillus helveticus]